jgi:hypothetical protein
MLNQFLNNLRPKFASAAQVILDEWIQDENGYDELYGYGGACDDIAIALSTVISDNILGVEIEDGGQDGDDHVYITVNDENETYIIDIPHHLYEIGAGYTWKKRNGVKINPSDILIAPLSI